jgi:hypothetical protein
MSWSPRWSRPAERDALITDSRWPPAAACHPSTIGRIWRQFELKPHMRDFSSSLDRPAVRRQGRRCRRALPPPARGRGRVVRGRGVRDAGPRPRPAGDAGHAREPPTTTSATAPPACSPPSTSPTAASSANSTASTARRSSASSSRHRQARPQLEVHLICDNLATHTTPGIHDWLAYPASTCTSPRPLGRVVRSAANACSPIGGTPSAVAALTSFGSSTAPLPVDVHGPLRTLAARSITVCG